MGVKPINLQHYDLKSLAKNLKLASIDVIKTTSTDIESHWFRSIGPADLYYWKAKNKIIKHQISLYNQVIEWNAYEGVKTGFMNDEAHQGESEVILFDEVVNEKVVEQAVEFLNLVKCIENHILKDLISHYQFYNRWPMGSPMKAMRGFFKKFSKKS